MAKAVDSLTTSQDKRATITQDRLKEALVYDPETGLFRWRSPRKHIHVGDIAGSPDKDGYILIKIDQRVYKAHRLVFFWMTGQWPPNEVDHKDRNKSNNRWSNLRAATKSQNMGNLCVRHDSATKLRGVQFDARRGLYYSTIRVNKRKHWLGYFPNPADAVAAYRTAAHQLRGQFAET